MGWSNPRTVVIPKAEAHLFRWQGKTGADLYAELEPGETMAFDTRDRTVLFSRQGDELVYTVEPTASVLDAFYQRSRWRRIKRWLGIA